MARRRGVEVGSLGLSGEGWFDGWSLQHFRRAAIAGGARFVHAEATQLVDTGGHVSAVTTADGTRFDADLVLVAAGAWSAALLAPLGLDLPVRAQARRVRARIPAALPGCPLVIDTSGVWFRPEGRGFIAGAPPRVEVDEAPLDAIDHGLFDDLIWPALPRACRASEALRTTSAWAGYYDEHARPQRARRSAAGLEQPAGRLRLLGARHAAIAGRRARGRVDARQRALGRGRSCAAVAGADAATARTQRHRLSERLGSPARATGLRVCS